MYRRTSKVSCGAGVTEKKKKIPIRVALALIDALRTEAELRKGERKRDGKEYKGEGREESVNKRGVAILVRENPPRALLYAVRDVPQVFSFPT